MPGREVPVNLSWSGYFRFTFFAGFLFGLGFVIFIGVPQQTSSSVSQPHASQTVTARPHERHTSMSPFFIFSSFVTSGST